MSQGQSKITENLKPVALGDAIRSYYVFIEEQYNRKEKSMLTELAVFSHKDHMVLNMTKTGTFTDKISALRDLTRVN